MIEKISRELRAKILDKYNALGHNEQAVAQHMGVSLKMVKYVVRTRWVYRHSDGFGPKNLRPFLVAIRLSIEPWDNTKPMIQKARELYNAGLIELCQGRDGANIIMYAIPRKHPVTRNVYFEDSNNDYENRMA